MARALLFVLAVASVSGIALEATAAPPVLSPLAPTSQDVITARIEAAPFSQISHDTVVIGNVIRTNVTVTNTGVGCPRYIAIETAQFGPLLPGSYFYDVYKVGTADDGSELKVPTLDSRQIITVTAAPEITFSATSTSIIAGQSVTLVWIVPDALAVRILGLDQLFGPIGSVTIQPKITVVCQLQAIGPNGLITREILLTVHPKRQRAAHR